MGEIRKNIPKEYKFRLPAVLDTVQYKGKFLIIAREEGNWIVLDNINQLTFFDSLKDYNLGEAMSQFNGEYADMQWVVTQIIAKHFEDPPQTQKIVPVMQIYLTNSCNMHCPHCYMSAGDAKKDELTTEEVINVLKEYKENDGVDVKLTGGEIALRDDLLEIAKYGSNIGLNIELLTNGTLWTTKQIHSISQYISVVQISIDGYSEEENSKIRGKGNFEKALITVDNFVKDRVSTRVAMTAYYNAELDSKITDYANFAKELRSKYNGYNFDVVMATGLLPGRYGNLSESESENYSKIMNKANSLYQDCEDFTDMGFINRHKSGVHLNNCSYGFMSLSSTGDVYVCPIITALKPIANIRTHSLKKIFSLLNYAHNLSFTDKLIPCRECELKAICGGDCRIRFFEDLRRPDIQNQKTFAKRKCDNIVKEKFFDLMIKTNIEIFH